MRGAGIVMARLESVIFNKNIVVFSGRYGGTVDHTPKKIVILQAVISFDPTVNKQLDRAVLVGTVGMKAGEETR